MGTKQKTRLNVSRGLVFEKFSEIHPKDYFLNPLTLFAGAAGLVSLAQAPSPKATATSATSAVYFMVWFPLLSKPVGLLRIAEWGGSHKLFHEVPQPVVVMCCCNGGILWSKVARCGKAMRRFGRDQF